MVAHHADHDSSAGNAELLPRHRDRSEHQRSLDTARVVHSPVCRGQKFAYVLTASSHLRVQYQSRPDKPIYPDPDC